MEAFWKFGGEHYFIVLILAYSVIHTVGRMYSRTLRSFNIRKHGYPANPIMDADGDIVYPKDKEE